MKKKNLKSLLLNKKSISHFNQTKINGGAISLICTVSLSWLVCNTGGDETLMPNTKEICEA